MAMPEANSPPKPSASWTSPAALSRPSNAAAFDRTKGVIKASRSAPASTAPLTSGMS